MQLNSATAGLMVWAINLAERTITSGAYTIKPVNNTSDFNLLVDGTCVGTRPTIDEAIQFAEKYAETLRSNASTEASNSALSLDEAWAIFKDKTGLHNPTGSFGRDVKVALTEIMARSALAGSQDSVKRLRASDKPKLNSCRGNTSVKETVRTKPTGDFRKSLEQIETLFDALGEAGFRMMFEGVLQFPKAQVEQVITGIKLLKLTKLRRGGMTH